MFNRAVRWIGISLLAYVALYLVLVSLAPLSDHQRRVIDDLGQSGAAVIAAVMCFTTSRFSVGRPRLAWTFIGLACASWAVGGLIWDYYELVLMRETPFPSLADVGYLGLLPCMLAGLVLLEPAQRNWMRIRTAFDGMALVLTIASALWLLLLQPIYADSTSSILQKAIGGAYPLGDLVILFALTLLLNRNRSRQATMVIGVFSAGLISFMLADVGFAYLTLNDLYFTGALTDVLWTAGFLLMGYSALLQLAWKPVAATEDTHVGTAWRQALPLLLILVVAAEEVTADAFGVQGLTTLSMAAAVLVLVVLRQAIVLRDNVALNRQLGDMKDRLEDRVKHRTSELEKALEQRTAALGQVERLASILEATPDFVMTTDLEGNFVYLNKAARRFHDLEAGAVPSTAMGEWYPPALRPLMETEAIPAVLRDGVWLGETELTSLRGDIPVSQVMVAHKNDEGRPEFLSMIARDVTQQRLLQDQLRYQAFFDQLSGLANRVHFMDRLEHGIARAARTGENIAVLFIDLDHFKSVNDNHGHSVGDSLLKEVGHRISSCLRAGDTPARLGGDEFAAVLDGIPESDTAVEIAVEIVEALSRPFGHNEEQIFISASVGVKLCCENEDADTCLRDSDIAMYSAKRNGRNRVELFSDSFHVPMLERMQIMGELQRAVDHGEFSLVYQPSWELGTGRLYGSEALVRWENPHRGLIGPSQFIALAEESGAIIPIGRWVLRQACAQAKVWQSRYPASADFCMSVNVSGRQLQSPGFVEDVIETLLGSGLKPGTLILEITESAVMGDVPQMAEVLKALKRAGAKLSIDDFGTGYSSLSYLRQFPFDELKIDKSFVDGLDSELAKDRELTETIMQIAKTLKLETVAEGIERPAQAEYLKKLNCDRAQGYLLSVPLRQDELDAMLAAREAKLAA